MVRFLSVQTTDLQYAIICISLLGTRYSLHTHSCMIPYQFPLTNPVPLTPAEVQLVLLLLPLGRPAIPLPVM